MPESFKRMYGPGKLSTDSTALTTLFTVPTGKTYVVRDILQVQQALAGPNDNSTTGVYYIDSTAVCTVGGPLTAGAASTQKFSGSIVVHEGQSFKGYIAGSAQMVGGQYSYANTGPDYQLMTNSGGATFTDTVTGGHSMYPVSSSMFWVANFAGTDPASSTISTTTAAARTSSPTADWGKYTSVVGVGTSAGLGDDYIMCNIGTLAVMAEGSTNAGIGVRFTGNSIDYAGTVFIPMASVPFATSAVVGATHAQTATATGTTATAATVTMTPTHSNSVVLYITCATGPAGLEIDTPANYTCLIDTDPFGGVISVGGRLAVFLVDGADATNPTANYSAAPAEWVACAVEIMPIQVATTVTGIVID